MCVGWIHSAEETQTHRCFPPVFLLSIVYLSRWFSSRRPHCNFSSIIWKILPAPLGDYNGPTGRLVTSQHGRCFLLTLLMPIFLIISSSIPHRSPLLHPTPPFFNVPVLCLKDACYSVCDLPLLFLSFSKMFIGGLSWQTTQGELSRTLL